ncbi:MAG: hypothetical protein ACYTGZ_02540 [Planctomycetota bacterium]|jgi:hypothetical protein
MTGSADELREVLRRMPREDPPDIPLEKLLSKLAAVRRRTLFAVAGAAAAGVILALTLEARPAEPPVYLDLQLVIADPVENNAPAPEDASGALANTTDLAEFERP